jgi:SulP family sulfate permease
MPHEFAGRLAWLAAHLPTLQPHAFGVSAGTLAVILLWPRIGLKAVPGPVAAVATATALVALAGWGSGPGVATIGSRFGADALTFHWPELRLPDLDWATLRHLIGPATAIALLGAIESLLSCVVADGLSGDRHDSNTELVAQGVANLVCPFLGGLPATGAIARTSSNIHNGARTPLAGMVHAATLLGIVLLGARAAMHIPMAAMAGVLAAVALRMGEWHELARLRRMPRSDALVLLTTCGLTVVFDLVVAVEVGMVLAAVLFIKRVSETTEVSLVTESDMLERPEHIAQGKPVPEGVVVYRIFGPFMFGAAEKMEDALARAEAWPRVLILRLHLVTAMDATGLHALECVVERMKARGGAVILSGIHAQPLGLLRKAGFIGVIGRDNLCATFDDALRRAGTLIAR